jgi:hypothetical protein
LKLRRRVLPWCMHRGCWQASYVVHFKGRGPHRGNLCALHFWEHLQVALIAIALVVAACTRVYVEPSACAERPGAASTSSSTSEDDAGAP